MRSKIKSDSIDLVFADPPYNLSGKNLKLIGNKTGGDFHMINENWDKMTESNYEKFTDEWIKCCYDLHKALWFNVYLLYITQHRHCSQFY